jgi:hypothetical protein
MSDAVAATGIKVGRGAEAAGVAVTSVSAADPAVVTTSAAHNMVTGDRATLKNLDGGVPELQNRVYSVTMLTATTYSLPVDNSGGGAAGAQGFSHEVVFSTVGEIVSVTPPGFSRNKLESTTHNDGSESYVLGILRQRDVAFRINYVGTNPTHEDIVADMFGNVRNWWMVLFPSGVEFIGPARVQRFEFADAGTDAIQQADCGLSWAGPVTMSVPA